jgi:hypothetical protein
MFNARHSDNDNNLENNMHKLMALSLAVLGLGVWGGASADVFANVYTCTLNDDVEMEDVQAQNSKWLAWVNANVEGGGITSAVGTAVVGNQEVFIFIDTYPSLASWAATAEALDSDAAEELGDLFEDTNECSKNALWKIEETK